MKTPLININLIIAGRNYRLKIAPEEKIIVQQMTQTINKKVAELEEIYGYAKDKQDYLAMTALLLCSELKIKQLTEKKNLANLSSQIEELDDLLNGFLSAKK